MNDAMKKLAFEDGNLWPLALIVTFVAPLLVSRLRGHSRPPQP